VRGGWVEKGTIGSGGFGVVKLFVNEVSTKVSLASLGMAYALSKHMLRNERLLVSIVFPVPTFAR